jgi:uncharacterized protein
MFFDPLYIVVMIVSAALSFGAQLWVMAKVRSQSQVPLSSGLTGADVAARILKKSGLPGVGIEVSHGFLSDHYDPSTRTLRLSQESYYGRSVAAAGIAAHEAGHALQHAQGYWPMKLRQKLVPLANLGTQLGVLMVVIGLLVGLLGLAKIGVVIFAGFVVFTLVTLPVEIDASSRAKAALAESRLLPRHELAGVSSVLTAAAATYVASALTAILQLLYYVVRLQGAQREE